MQGTFTEEHTSITAMATLAGLSVSFGSTGDCFDNAAIEST